MAACRQARFVAWTLGAKRRRMGFCKKHILHCSNRNPAHTYVFSASIDDAHGLANVIEKCDSISKMAVVGMCNPKFTQRQAWSNVIEKCEAFRRWRTCYIFSGASKPSMWMQSVRTRFVSCNMQMYPAFFVSSSSVSILTS